MATGFDSAPAGAELWTAPTEVVGPPSDPPPGAPPWPAAGDAGRAAGLYHGLFDEGERLPTALGAELESAIGAPLGDVRLRQDPGAAAREGAHAFAVGRDITFGRFDPGSDDGRWLLAHEVAHTVQQAGATPRLQGKLEQAAADSDEELAADRFADAFVRGEVGAADRPRPGSAGVQIARYNPGDRRREERHLGTDTPVENDDGTPRERTLDGRERDGRQHRTTVDEDGRERRRTRIHHRSDGILTDRRERGTRTEELDGQAMARQLHRELQTLDRELAADEEAAEGAEREAIQRRRRQVAEDLAAVASPARDLAPDTVDAIARRHRIPVEPVYRTAQADVRSDEDRTDLDPLDGEVGQTNTQRREIVEEDGLASTEENTRSRTVNLGDGSFESAEQREIVARPSGGETLRNTERRSTQVAVGNGGVNRERTVRNENEVENADGTSERNASEQRRRAGVVLTDDETGIRLGGTNRNEQETEDGEDAQETAVDATITDRRVAGRVAHERTQRRGNLEAGVTAAADGSFSIDLEPVDDGRYRLTFTIHLGAEVGGSLERSREEDGETRGVHVGGRARGSAQGDLVTTRMLSEAEAQGYLDAAERADRGEHPTNPAEFGRLARLRAAGGNLDALQNGMAVFNSSSSAAHMRDGESVTLDTRAAVGADVDGGYTGAQGGGSVEAGGGAEWQRIVQVERITEHDQPRVRITVTYRHASDWHVGGEGNVGPVGGGVDHREAEGDMERIQVVLDPAASDYDAQYDQVVGTLDRDQLRRVAADAALQDNIRARTRGASDESETGFEAGGTMGPRLTGQIGNSGSEEITETVDENGRGRLTGVVDGANTRQVGLELGGQEVGHVGENERAHAVLDADRGLEIDLEQADTNTDPLRTGGDAIDAIRAADTRGRINQAVAESPRERLNQLLTTEYEHLSGYHLDEHDVETLAERAGNSDRWRGCCVAVDRDIMSAWASFGRQLAHPRPDAHEAEINREDAIKLARARAVRGWMRAGGGRAFESLEQALRNYAADQVRESDEVQLGRGYEWPTAISEEGAAYRAVVPELQSLGARHDDLLEEEDGKGTEREIFLRLSEVLNRTLRAVRACDDFRSEGRRSELIGELEQHRGDLALRHREFMPRWDRRHPRDGSAPEQAPERGSPEAQAELHQHFEARGRATIRAAIRTLRANHDREHDLLVQAGQLLADDPYDHERDQAIHICSTVHNLHRSWIAEILNLRAAYEQAEVPADEWQVSSRPGDHHSEELEPHIGWLVNVYRRANNGWEGVLNHGVDPSLQWEDQRRY